MPELTFSAEAFTRKFRLNDLEAALPELDKMRQAVQIRLSPGWDLSHTLDHCARSIEHSMLGFPEQKNIIFQSLIGSAAFRIFDARGYMNHDLEEEIPGDVFESPAPALEAAIERLQNSIHTFLGYQGELRPHFAYGKLSKSQYNRANAMHIANHFDGIRYE